MDSPWRRPQGGQQSLTDAQHEPERIPPRAREVDQRQDYKPVNKEADEYRHDIPAEGLKGSHGIIHTHDTLG